MSVGMYVSSGTHGIRHQLVGVWVPTQAVRLGAECLCLLSYPSNIPQNNNLHKNILKWQIPLTIST